MYKIQERRKYVRIEKPYITRFRVKPNDGRVTKNWDMVAARNLSAGGISYILIQIWKLVHFWI